MVEEKSKLGLQDVQIYETFGTDSSDEEPNAQLALPVNEDIETVTPSMDAALQTFLEAPYRTNESVQDKVLRIRREIEELRREGAGTESKELLDELKHAVASRTPHGLPVVPQAIVDNCGITENTAEVAYLEARVAKIETLLGSSARAPAVKTALSVSICRIREVLELLTLDKDSLKATLEQISAVKPTKNTYNGSDEQIAFTYRQLQQLNGKINEIPAVVSRLQSLRQAHNDLIQTAGRMHELEKQLGQITTDVDAWRTMLQKMETNVDSYIKISRENIAKLGK